MHFYLPTHSDTALRLVAAAALGALIGLNREMRGKPAGLRTHSLVTLGAALMTLCGIYLSMGEGADATSRVIQGIITGATSAATKIAAPEMQQPLNPHHV